MAGWLCISSVPYGLWSSSMHHGELEEYRWAAMQASCHAKILQGSYRHVLVSPCAAATLRCKASTLEQYACWDISPCTVALPRRKALPPCTSTAARPQYSQVDSIAKSNKQKYKHRRTILQQSCWHQLQSHTETRPQPQIMLPAQWRASEVQDIRHQYELKNRHCGPAECRQGGSLVAAWCWLRGVDLAPALATEIAQ